MVVSALGAAAADTRDTAPPLIYQTTPSRLVALLSRWQTAEKKIAEMLCSGWILAGRPMATSELSSPA